MDIGYFESLEDFISEARNTNDKYLLLVGQDTSFNLNELNSSNIEAYGAIFPEVIYEDKSVSSAIVAYKLPENSQPYLIEDINNYQLNSKDFENMQSVICFVDGLSANVTEFLEDIFDLMPEDTQIVGGGAGKLPFEQDRVIFNSSGIFQDSALMIGLKRDIYVGVKHGWQILKSPLVATLSTKNRLDQIDYEDAFNIYKEIVESDYQKSFDSEPFLDVVKAYPLGIIKFDNEVIVRDPIASIEDKGLLLVAGIPQNSVISVLKGNNETLISAASEASHTAVSACSLEFEKAFVFDCISRRMFLADDFSKELDAVKENLVNKHLIGALTLGEIANDGNSYISFFNKTCVVGVLC